MSGDAVNHHGFALDITYAGYSSIVKKMENIAKRLQQGKLGKVDFFKSNDGKFKGQLSEIPLVVIGADGNTMRGLVNMFAEQEDQKIEEHPVQYQIVEQVIMQCDLFIKIGKQIEDQETQDRIVGAYENLKKDFILIQNLKQKLNGGSAINFRDTFHENLEFAIENFGKEN